MKNAAVNPVAFFLTGADPNSATDLTGMSRIPHKVSQTCPDHITDIIIRRFIQKPLLK